MTYTAYQRKWIEITLNGGISNKNWVCATCFVSTTYTDKLANLRLVNLQSRVGKFVNSLEAVSVKLYKYDSVSIVFICLNISV